MTFLKRINFHTKRFRGEILYSSIILGILMLLIAVAFPKGNDAIAGYVGILSSAGLDALFATFDLDAPGWLFWVSLMGSAYTYFVTAVAAIRIGSKLFPSNEDSALELITSSPKGARSYFLENILSKGFLILLFSNV